MTTPCTTAYTEHTGQPLPITYAITKSNGLIIDEELIAKIFISAWNGDIETLEQLIIEYDLDVNNIFLRAHSLMIATVSTGDYYIQDIPNKGGERANSVQKLIDLGGIVQTPKELGLPPLFIATLNGHTTTMKILLDAGADPNATHDDPVLGPITPLDQAIIDGKKPPAKLLLDNGADPLAGSAFPLAIEYNQLEILKSCLQKSIGKTETPTCGDYAVMSGNPKALKMCLTYGARPSLPPDVLFDHAYSPENSEIREILERIRNPPSQQPQIGNGNKQTQPAADMLHMIMLGGTAFIVAIIIFIWAYKKYQDIREHWRKQEQERKQQQELQRQREALHRKMVETAIFLGASQQRDLRDDSEGLERRALGAGA